MPISFGSVGDIISICLIVKDLVEALDDSRGSLCEYRELIRELWSLDRALLEVDLLSRTCENTAKLNALCKTAKQAAGDCRHCIEEFSNKIKTYGPALSESGSRNILRDTIMKIRWASQKDDLAKFRAEVTAHVHSINMLLASASINILQINDRKLNARLTERSDSQDTHIIEVRNRLQENNKLISIGNTVATKIADNLRLDWIRQLGLELKSMMQRIFNTNIATYKAVVALEARLPRSLDEEPFLLEDAIGRIAPVHMRFINSWEAFDAVLELRFRSVQGHKKVKNGEYLIQEHATRREIRRNLPWEVSFLPGHRFDMSLIFENRNGNMLAETTCPTCQTVSSELQESDVECTSCGQWYRRTTEYNDVEPPPIPTISTPRMKDVRFGQSAFAKVHYGPELPKATISSGTKRKLSAADLEDTDDVALFKRVRVISKHDRVKNVLKAFSLHASASSETIMNARVKQEAEEQEARKLFEERAARLGMDHPDTHSSLNVLGWCLRNQRKFTPAEDLFRTVYETRKSSLIIDDPETLQFTILNLMTVLADQNKASQIDELRQTASALFRSNMEPDAADLHLQRLQVLQISRNREKQTQERSFSGVHIILGSEAWQPRL